MTQPRIDISTDTTRPEGGHAIVLVHGLTKLPDSLKFKISAIPENPDDLATSEEWSLGEHEPLATEMTPDGLKLQLGPDIVDAAELQPGTPVSFTLAAADVHVELSWPDLPVTIPEKLATPIIDPSDLRGQKIEFAQREAEAAAKAAADAEAKAQADKLRDAAIADAIRQKAASEAGRAGSAATPIATPALAPAGASTATPLAAAGSPVSRVPVARIGNQLSVPQSVAASPHTLPAVQEIAATESRADRSGSNWFTIVLAIIALPALLFALWPSLPTGTSQLIGQTGLERLASSDWMTRILAVGDRSPSGIDASNVTADEALKKAEQSIFDSGGEPNLAERKFWLRKSITLMLAEPQSRWAVTQLGALHTAASDAKKRPDYESAKTLWEIASASGDTVATCFLAQLYELGLGVVASKESAKKWYRRAESRGGCNLQHERRPAPALTN